MTDRYRKGSHSVYDIKYHFVWKTKYSYGVLRGEVALRFRQIIREICKGRRLEILEQMGITPVIPPKKNRRVKRPYDKHLYGARHLIENFFAKLKQYRAIATRYDKLARNFLSGIYLAAGMIWLN